MTQELQLTPAKTTGNTPGYKSLLVSTEVFEKLRAIQMALSKPNRISVADLANAAIDEALSLSTAEKIAGKARRIVGLSFKNED